MRVYNFSAGPSMLPLEVLEQAQADFVDYQGCGMSVTEMSHRSKQFDAIHNECISLIRELMGVPENYEILLVQGGASTQFAAIPMNLLKSGKADYVVTGNFAKKAMQEARKYGDIHVAGSSEEAKFTYIPKENLPISPKTSTCARTRIISISAKTTPSSERASPSSPNAKCRSWRTFLPTFSARRWT